VSAPLFFLFYFFSPTTRTEIFFSLFFNVLGTRVLENPTRLHYYSMLNSTFSKYRNVISLFRVFVSVI
jgi:hypothetical protein